MLLGVQEMSLFVGKCLKLSCKPACDVLTASHFWGQEGVYISVVNTTKEEHTWIYTSLPVANGVYRPNKVQHLDLTSG